jgi:transcriptional regulator NrdR family protein
MEAMIKRIQKSLSSGQSIDIKTGELASKVLDEIKKAKKEPAHS